MRFEAIQKYFIALSEGDPVAVGFTAIIGAIALILGLWVWITQRQLDAEDRQIKKRRGY
ncbi:MAG: hypothetical protein RMJ56_06510 [Gemmataceae bacterium]|nr:hypothetical protein [Gemmata sp.]MDW8197242.1 hypothetical protein [Gemmataceae bacterium]